MTDIKSKAVSLSKTITVLFEQTPTEDDDFIISGIPENSKISIRIFNDGPERSSTITDWEPTDCMSAAPLLYTPAPIADFNFEYGNGYHVISFRNLVDDSDGAVVEIEVEPQLQLPAIFNYLDLERKNLDREALANRDVELRHCNGSVIKAHIDEAGQRYIAPTAYIKDKSQWSCFIKGEIPLRARYADELSQGTVFQGINSEGKKRLLVKSYGPRAFDPETVDFTLELDRQWMIDESYPTYPLNTILKP